LFNFSKFNQEIPKCCCRKSTYHRSNNQVLRGHNFSPHGNVNFIAPGSVKQHQEGMRDLNHKHEPPQLKEGSTSVIDLLGVSYTIRPRADQHHDLIEGSPQWGGECSYPKVLNMTTPNKSSSSQVGNSTRRSVAPTSSIICLTNSPSQRLNGTLTRQCSQHILQCQPTAQGQLRKLLP